MPRRPHTSTLLEARTECQRCTWSTNGNNAQGLAAQHFDSKGHQVRVTITNEIVYGRQSGTAKSSGEKQEKFI